MRSLLRRSLVLATLLALLLGVVGTAAPIASAAQPTSTRVAGINVDASTIPQLQALMDRHRLTSVQLVQFYLHRIRQLNPKLHAVITVSDTALADARAADKARRRGLHKPLLGIPVIVKDNVNTTGMPTTAGSYALEGSTPSDAFIVQKLRAAGAIVIAKANLSEWANFRSNPSSSGWSGIGGQTNMPYVLDRNPCGSSSGSGVAAAADLATVAIGTETDGSVVCPAGNNAVVGLKPTIGLVAQDGIIPIAHSQDSAGPMGRSVTDVAILLNAMVSPFGAVAGHDIPDDYTAFLERGALDGARIGVDRRLFSADYFADLTLNPLTEDALTIMAAAGATIIDPVDAPDPFVFFDAEFTVLLHEFKEDIATYLSGLSHTNMRSLADLIAFNQAHCDAEMRYFGQELFEISEGTAGTSSDEYLEARALCLEVARDGIDTLMADLELDAIVAPIYSFGSSAPAAAGYPIISVPTGVTEDGRPGGVWMYAGFLQEGKLLALGYDLEQEVGGRPQPHYLGSLPALPPDAGICATPLAARRQAKMRDVRERMLKARKPAHH